MEAPPEVPREDGPGIPVCSSWSRASGRSRFRCSHPPLPPDPRRNGRADGASSDLQVARVRQLVTHAGQAFEYVSLPTTPHSLHGSDPQLYVDSIVGSAETLREPQLREEWGARPSRVLDRDFYRDFERYSWCGMNSLVLDGTTTAEVEGRSGLVGTRRHAHNPKVVGSNPTPATMYAGQSRSLGAGSLRLWPGFSRDPGVVSRRFYRRTRRTSVGPAVRCRRVTPRINACSSLPTSDAGERDST